MSRGIRTIVVLLRTTLLLPLPAAAPPRGSTTFVFRRGAGFHNGDPDTAEDVKFSFERYKGAAAPLFKDRVREVQVVDATHVRFQLKEPWPDFMTFYGTSASGAAYVVPK